VGVRWGLAWGLGIKYISTYNLACPYVQAPAKTVGIILYTVLGLSSPLEKRTISNVKIILLASFMDDSSKNFANNPF